MHINKVLQIRWHYKQNKALRQAGYKAKSRIMHALSIGLFQLNEYFIRSTTVTFVKLSLWNNFWFHMRKNITSSIEAADALGPQWDNGISSHNAVNIDKWYCTYKCLSNNTSWKLQLTHCCYNTQLSAAVTHSHMQHYTRHNIQNSTISQSTIKPAET